MKLAQRLVRDDVLNRSHANRQRVLAIVALCGTFFLWAYFAPLDEIVRGTGKVVPAMRNQVIQNLEGGIVKEIFVQEGDAVDAGQLIVQMDSTRYESAFQELENQRISLSLRLERLRAEGREGSEFVPSENLVRLAPEQAASEERLYIARQSALEDAVESLEKSIKLNHEELSIIEAMAERDAVPRIEVIRAREAGVELEGRLARTRSEFETQRAAEYAETLVKLQQIEEQMLTRRDQLSRTMVRTPIRGIVNQVLATTIGGVVQPGAPLVEIISLEDKLRVEGMIDPKDIGFVYPGMKAKVKLSAYDFSVYGILEGSVAHVGADTVMDEGHKDMKPYYRVYIELDSISLTGRNETVEIRPGMQAEIELAAGNKTVLQYLLKPLLKSTNALTER